MLIVMCHNDGTGDIDVGNYDVEVYINKTRLWQGRVIGHNRTKGWQDLLRQVAEVGKIRRPRQI